MSPRNALFSLLGLVLSVGAVVAGPITPTGGESFLLAYGVGDGARFEFRSTYGPWGGQTPLPFNVPGGSSTVIFNGDGGSASADFSHTASNTAVSITGSTAASSVAGGTYVGQAAGDDTGVVSTDFDFGYYVEFDLDDSSIVRVDVDGTTNPGESGYADFGAILFGGPGDNPTRLFSFGGTSGGSISQLLTLGPGTYFLFVQSQSAVYGNSADSASASFTASVNFVSPIPEPVSLAVFGGLLAAGGVAVARRRMKLSQI